MSTKQAWVIGTPQEFNICKSTQRPYNALCLAPEGVTDPHIIVLTEDSGVYTASVDATLQSNRNAQLAAAADTANWAYLRRSRNMLLNQSDWTQVGDAPLTSQQKTDWQTYRQALRDLPANTVDPLNPTWPQEPS